MNKVKCPNCGSYKTESVRGKILAVSGFIVLVLGIVTLFTATSFGIFMSLLGVVLIGSSQVKSKNTKYHCAGCGHVFIPS